jgi:hypothetical protein
MDNFCDNMFSSLKATIDTFKNDVSIQEIARAFIQTIQNVYAQHIRNLNICNFSNETSNDLHLMQANDISAVMVKNVSDINSKYFQMIYRYIVQLNIGIQRNSNFLEETKQQHIIEINKLIDQSYENFQILINKSNV